MTDITTNGYIVHDNEGVIHGYSTTSGGAWDDMLNTMKHANIEVLDDYADTTNRDGSWTLASGMTIAPATAALLQHVEDHGGNCTWGKIGSVACTVDEEEA